MIKIELIPNKNWNVSIKKEESNFDKYFISAIKALPGR